MQLEQVETTKVTVSGSLTTLFAYGDKEGPTILAIHGFRGTHHGLEPLAQALAGFGYRVLVPDLPGAGDSSAMVGSHNAMSFGAWLGELTESLPVSTILLGHSFGSVIVASAIAQGADHRSAVLVNPILKPPLTGPRRVATAATRAYYALAGRLPLRFGERLLASRLIAGVGGAIMTSTSDAGQRKWIRKEHRRHAGSFSSRAVVIESFIASTTTTVLDFADHLQRPVLLCGAGRDPLTPASVYNVEATGIQSGTFHVFPDRGHLLPFEEVDSISQLIANWDGMVEPPTAGSHTVRLVGSAKKRATRHTTSLRSAYPSDQSFTDRGTKETPS
ncbi:alpha/beta fold hydrolase [Leucobacter aridicollis]|uniref:alpha/beta fold hydrolase n=1 Tax=Leucobacter aridicollis TaxID=283878 RepID=UPI0021683701|nr:alpha/beta hydrolase [Leucobacter aridicollis]MCS3426429.1 pimeloyl-ACP methyl ester carboxylesterase [Leucobacter aridicollis]